MPRPLCRGARGWLAIAPKRLAGERGFDIANIFCNSRPRRPDPAGGNSAGRFTRRVEVVAEAAGLERKRLLRWVLAWAGLSAAWLLGDGDAPEIDLRVAELAAAELDQ